MEKDKNNEVSRRTFLAGTGAVLAAGLLSKYKLQASVEAAEENKRTSETSAVYFMEKYSTIFPSWNGAELSVPVIYYATEDTSIPVAYEYTVIKNGESAGFMIISTEDTPQLLELSNAKAPSSYLDSARVYANRAGYITDGENPLILYCKRMKYSVQFGNKMKEKGIAIRLMSGKVQKVPKATVL